MKTRAAILLAASTLLVGCGSKDSEKSLEVSCEEMSTHVSALVASSGEDYMPASIASDMCIDDSLKSTFVDYHKCLLEAESYVEYLKCGISNKRSNCEAAFARIKLAVDGSGKSSAGLPARESLFVEACFDEDLSSKCIVEARTNGEVASCVESKTVVRLLPELGLGVE